MTPQSSDIKQSQQLTQQNIISLQSLQYQSFSQYLFFYRQTPFKLLPSQMAPSPMLCTRIDVETCSGLEELPLATTVDLWGTSMPITHCLVKTQEILLAKIYKQQNGPMWSITSAVMSVFQLSHLLLQSHVNPIDTFLPPLTQLVINTNFSIVLVPKPIPAF